MADLQSEDEGTVTLAEWAETHGYNLRRRKYRKVKVVPGAVPGAHTEQGPDPAA